MQIGAFGRIDAMALHNQKPNRFQAAATARATDALPAAVPARNGVRSITGMSMVIGAASSFVAFKLIIRAAAR